MSDRSSPRLVRLRRAVDADLLGVLRAVDATAAEFGCPFFVAGATARDLILVNVHGLRTGRATRDIDFGIAVESWDVFRLLKERLAATGRFTMDTRAQQRLIYRGCEEGAGIPIDLIPFGGVAGGDQIVAWPPGRDVVLDVTGFEEAWASADTLVVEEGLAIRVASAAGLTLLKLVAWVDRHAQSNKDAVDLYRLLTSYGDAGNVDRLYEEEAALLEANGFDMAFAGAELLGRDVARICAPALLERTRAWLATGKLVERLIGQMVQSSSHEEARGAIERLVERFRRGLGRR